jgi:hypothetical protein
MHGIFGEPDNLTQGGFAAGKGSAEGCGVTGESATRVPILFAYMTYRDVCHRGDIELAICQLEPD